MIRPIRIILLLSVSLTVLLYWVDIYMHYPSVPVKDWQYRLILLFQRLALNITLFFTVFTSIYYAIVGVRKLLKMNNKAASAGK